MSDNIMILTCPGTTTAVWTTGAANITTARVWTTLAPADTNQEQQQEETYDHQGYQQLICENREWSS